MASEPALEELDIADGLKMLLFGGRTAQLGWCNGHNTRLNCLEYHRASEFNLGTRDFILLLAKLDEVEGGVLDTACVKAFRAPAGVLVEVFATTLHYAPCMVDAEGFRVLVALPAGTNGPLPQLPPRPRRQVTPLSLGGRQVAARTRRFRRGRPGRPRGPCGREHRHRALPVGADAARRFRCRTAFMYSKG